MSASHDIPKWPTPPPIPLLPAAPIPSGVGVPLFVAGCFIPLVRPVAAAVVVGVRYYNDSTLPRRKIEHKALIEQWARELKPVEILHVSSHKELEAAVARFRAGQVGPGSQIMVTGAYAEQVLETHEKFCNYYADHRDEKVKIFGHIVKFAALTAAVAASPVGGSAKAAAHAFLAALPSSFKSREETHGAKHAVESEHVVETFDLIEVAISVIGGMTHNRWRDRRLMPKVSAKLVQELLYNGASFTDNDGESFLIRWGEVVGHQTIEHS